MDMESVTAKILNKKHVVLSLQGRLSALVKPKGIEGLSSSAGIISG